MTQARISARAETRRTILSRTGWLALLPMWGLGRVGALARVFTPIEPPAGAMILSRLLQRDLVDNKVLSVTREWRCEFTKLDAGMTISGYQTSVEVDAPASLAPLAEIEKTRVVEGFFPVALDAAGLIVSAGTGTDQSTIVRAIDTAAAIFASVPAGTLGDADPHAFMAHLANSAAQTVSRVPRDLFYPAPGEWSDIRPFPLDGEEPGEIEVQVSASAREPDGLLQACERIVRIGFAGRIRQSRERWTLREM